MHRRARIERRPRPETGPFDRLSDPGDITKSVTLSLSGAAACDRVDGEGWSLNRRPYPSLRGLAHLVHRIACSDWMSMSPLKARTEAAMGRIHGASRAVMATLREERRGRNRKVRKQRCDVCRGGGTRKRTEGGHDNRSFAFCDVCPISRRPYINSSGGAGPGMSAGIDEIIYHLTPRGWEAGDEPPDRVESWRCSISQTSGVSWRCIWEDDRRSTAERDALRERYRRLPV